jgi:1-acyl-sn-glycerol-3-phosphate acyltransferase
LIGVVFAWLVFFRPAFEYAMEIFLWPIYRVKGFGPGMAAMPWKGPALLIGNHAAWFDPLWLSKVAACPTTYMMTSKFYDIRFLAWLMRDVYGAIRVPDVHMRKEAPEIQEAIAALDRGESVVIFPEGWLRRKEEQELRRFGRGVWQILAARPDTPVFACWIEGNWGSCVSWKNGPPFKGKPLDFWRSIQISIIEPFTMDKSTLESHMETRKRLMRAVLEARALHGLPPIDPFVLRAVDDETPKKEDQA